MRTIGFRLVLSCALLADAAASRAQTLGDYFELIPPAVIDRDYAPRFTNSFTVTADLDGDGNQDLIMLGADYEAGGVTFATSAPQPGRVYLGDGTGRFTQAPATRFPVDTLRTVLPRKVLFADFNGDGRLDMFLATTGWDGDPWPGEQNRLYLSTSDGGWRDVTSTLPALNDFSHGAAAGDLSGRGVVDIVVDNGYFSRDKVLSYALINNGAGVFTRSDAGLPIGPGQMLDFNTHHHSPGATLADLDGDGRADLVLLAGLTTTDRSGGSRIMWNRDGVFSDLDKTDLPGTAAYPYYTDMDARPLDFNGDGRMDLVVVGAKFASNEWYVQIFLNTGNHTFIDVTASRIPAGATSGTPMWPFWVNVLDFNGDGAPDFAIEYARGDYSVPFRRDQPLVFLNDGTGRFSALTAADFVEPGGEWKLGATHLAPTREGFSFITTQRYPGSGGLIATGLRARRPYRLRPTVAPRINELAVGAFVASTNGRYRLTYQPDGNLTLTDAGAASALWDTNTGGVVPGRVVMQSDGNLVVLDASGAPAWSSGTSGNPEAYFLVQDDGNLVIFSAAGRPIWNRLR